MSLIIFGPPGSGKGTQSEHIAKKFAMKHISTGDALRNALREKTPVGLKAKAVMESGELVSDDIVTDLLREIIRPLRPKTDRFLFDGYPRTVEQVNRLDGLIEEFDLPKPLVINLEVPEDLIMRRLTGRRVCENCGATYNVYFDPPEKEGICDRCGGPLTKRSDDEPETVRERLRVYNAQSSPVLDIYRQRGRFHSIDATGSAEEVFNEVSRIIEENY